MNSETRKDGLSTAQTPGPVPKASSKVIMLGILFAFIVLCMESLSSWANQPHSLQYQSLDMTGDGLRLLVLEPGPSSDPIRCKLYSTTFAERPLYSALSYTWGDQGETKYIEIDGRTMQIGKNLWTALRHLRHMSHSQTLWVDSICINQSSIEEKNHQIPIMAFIYGRAKQVIVWLGQHQENDTTCDLGAFSSVGLSRGKASYDNSAWDHCWTSVRPLLYQLIHEEYWKRTWIIQEIGMASNIRVYFGERSLSWDNFLALVKWYQEQNPPIQSVHYILKLERLRESRYRDGTTYALSDLLDTFRNSFCAVVHDKVYAFLGLANDHFGEINVNYSKSVFELYQDVIKFQSISTLESTQKRIEMVYLSALVRQILSRESGRLPKERNVVIPNSFMTSHKTWTNWYLIEAGKAIARDEMQRAVARRHCEGARRNPCGKEGKEECENARRDVCREADAGGEALGYLLLYMLLYPLVHSWIAVQDWLSILKMRRKTELTMFWHPTAAEKLEIWRPKLFENAMDGIRIRGSIVGRVQYIGPLSDDILSSFDAKKRWAAILSSQFSQSTELRRVRGQNERLMHILEDPSGISTRNIRDLHEEQQGQPQEGQRLFLGSNLLAGIVPPSAKVGDTICQFWNSSASAVLRQDIDGVYHVIGRAGIVQYGESNNWDVPKDKKMFDESSNSGIDIAVNIMTLTRLSMDTVNFLLST